MQFYEYESHKQNMDLLKGESKDFGFDKNIPPLLKTFQQFKEIYYIYKYIHTNTAKCACTRRVG